MATIKLKSRMLTRDRVVTHLPLIRIREKALHLPQLPVLKTLISFVAHPRKINSQSVSVNCIRFPLVALLAISTQRVIRSVSPGLCTHGPPDRHSALDFNPSVGRACRIDNFQPDFDSSANTPWNKSAAKVFVDYFMASDIPESADADKKDVLRVIGGW